MKISGQWADILKEEFEKEYYKELCEFLETEYAQNTIFPKKEELFTALMLTPYSKTQVVILGQDPYHGAGQAHGLSFSVKDKSAKFPPSLRNIFKELESDLGIKREEKDLSDWAQQGVLLLNTVLTVREAQAASHKNKGWENFTTAIITKLNEKTEPIIFVLWGNDAKSKKVLLTNPIHKTLESVHPSPLSASRGFFGSAPFSKIDAFLKENYGTSVNW